MAASISNNFVIAQTISQFLRPSDLASCVRVSKEWNIHFTPRLWHTVNFNTNFREDTLIRHRNYIRNIDALSECLRYPGRLIANFDQFIAVPTFLRRLSINFDHMNPILEERWITSLDHHSRLEHLELRYISIRYPKFLPRLLYICPHLHTLHLSVKMYKHTHTVAQQERLLAREAMDDMGQSNLRDLYLDIGDEAIECLILLSLLEHTPNLEKLRLPKLYNGDSFRRIAEVFRDKEDLNLKHLFLECSSCDSIDGIKELFHTIGEIRGLQSLEIKNHSDMGPTIIPECFDLSLTKLSIFSCIHILTLTETLNRLPHLMSLEARVHLDLTETIIGTSWACIGLKKLSLEIISATGNVELVEYIFNQIGSFKDLEELRLDGDQYHLRLKEGYLRSLEHLTKLREISIQPFGYSPHVREAQWFVDHWGCLSLFRFESQSSPPCYQKFYNEGRYNRFIKRLLSSRPWIQIEIEEKVINP